MYFTNNNSKNSSLKSKVRWGLLLKFDNTSKICSK